ncbi:MAG: D-2-hydroxyacid dehydrogenase [Isosphaeraceae bacterium]|nr:D-2-hydroxyacid dehydrogenase [Isosphaeraceae bacterium]
MKTIVIHPPLDADRLSALKRRVPGAAFTNAETPGAAAEAIGEADAFLGKLTPELLARARRLTWVQAFTVSLEHYMFDELVEHPCRLSNMRGLFGDVIADQVMGYVISFARNLHLYVRRQVERRYEPLGGEAARVSNAAGPGVVNDMDRAVIHLPGSTMGIVGFGAIGAEIARRATAFGMRVIGVDRKPGAISLPEGVERVDGIERLDDLLTESRFVVIAAPQTPETTRLFDRRKFAAMRSDAYLINIGRGAIVVLDDLVAALESRTIAGAALDVFEVEPLPSSHRLWEFENVIITPHTAGYSTMIAQRHLQTMIENVERFVAGDEPRNLVDKRLWF